MQLFGQESQPGKIGPFKTRETAKNDAVNQVNVTFQENIMSQLRPVQRMLGQDGSFAPGALAAAGTGFPSKDNLFQFLRNNYPSDRGINMEALDQTHLQGQQEYNTALMTNYNVQRNRGMSERKLRNKIGAENPELLSYSIQQGLVEPKVEGLLDDFLVALGAGGAALGTSKLYGMSGKPSAPGNKALSALRKRGFDYNKKTGRIIKMSDPDIRDTLMQNKKKPDNMNKAVKAIQKKQKFSGVGKQALKKGGSKRVRNIATNVALKNVGKHFGTKAAIGIAGRIAGGLMSWPIALGIGAAQVAPLVYRYFKDEE